MFITSVIIICRTCRNHTHTNRDHVRFHYIAGMIGIIHALFNLPARISDVLLLSSAPYVSFFTHLIHFNHEAQSFISLSYGYKCFICIILSRRFRSDAKNILSFLIGSKREKDHITEWVNKTNQLSRRISYRRYYQAYEQASNFSKNLVSFHQMIVKENFS